MREVVNPVLSGVERGHRGPRHDARADGLPKRRRRARLLSGRGTPQTLERISGALDGLTLASDTEVPTSVATLGMLADEIHLQSLAEWAGEMWQAVMHDDPETARSLGRTARHTILSQATEELAGVAGRRGTGEDTVGSTDLASRADAAATAPYAGLLVALSFVAAMAAVALVLAYVVGRYSMVVFGQLFR